MVLQNIVHRWAMIFNFFMGIGLIAIAISVLRSMNKSCTSPVINNGMNFILAIGFIMLTMALVFFSCGDINCVTTAYSVGVTYLVVILVISIAVLGVSVTMFRELKKDNNTNVCGSHTNSMIILLMVLSIVSGGFSAFTLSRTFNTETEQPKSERNDSRRRDELGFRPTFPSF